VLAIETENLTKDYALGFWRRRPYRALDGLTLSVEAGEIFGFLGPNGAGKTTTLKLLMQLVFPTSGRAAILGRPVGDVSTRGRVGYLPENPYFYDHLTAEELLQYFGKLFGLRAAERRQRAAALLDELGLGAERRMPLRRYSKGMLQRVGLAQALLNQPEVVFLDEPMSGLDPIGRRMVRQMILSLRDRGTTVFFSSHILADAEAICSRVAILAGGRLLSTGRLNEIVALDVKGFEVVVDGVTDAMRDQIGRIASAAQKIADGLYTLECPAAERPDRLVARLGAVGVTVVSVNPIRETLEDVFLREVSAHGNRRVI
jgi:ABC-2 type transport system ATP-binding protein